MSLRSYVWPSIVIFLGLLSTEKCWSATADDLAGLSEREVVEALVRKWAPLVWLAPNEKYLPGSVSTFLEHVHAEKVKVVTVYPGNEISDVSELNHYPYYYDTDNELTYYDPTVRQARNRNKRNFRDPSTSLDLLFDLPIGNESKNWYLVTNNEVEELITDKSSFIYGQNPQKENVPIYAVVSMCRSTSATVGSPSLVAAVAAAAAAEGTPPPVTAVPVSLSSSVPLQPPTTTYPPPSATAHHYNHVENEVVYNTIDHIGYKRQSYAPVHKNLFELQPELKPDINKIEKSIRLIRKRRRRGISMPQMPVLSNRGKDEEVTESPSEELLDKLMEGRAEDEEDDDNESFINNDNDADEWETITERRDGITIQSGDDSNDYPHFHVTYWMFYPYSQGKVICTVNLGPLGPWPIPLLFGMCLGTKKEFGSHVGDWEHMSLFFRGKKEPDEMYVSAHDAGAFYSYERLTGTFEYRSQETRKGILQRPTFPKTVITSGNHPVLFAAEGSHGLWTAPGKHKYVRVPRLYDVNGFGTPWTTWKSVEVIHENDSKGRTALNPKWLKFNGRWGNPKNRCHPLKRFGLHICELTDGPTGIPRKKPHFKCKKR
ncbi:uncharacterized protein LOC129725061 [Wyeomyia smithii]|uniref:uncharacterized protein LOC129725061 n=1 Tax=Wyeomyia smithii TaxID=174621 RepID=UPI002467EE37|nr:uncharacterized protein LOC129725061 [Wyeomyia smithii]XP_055536434.1 uncharacterized protein LOC129725061 [Wyeomyia smithii]XP_055536435.1 uncharacterized protein LOC129725061 [Wyeomyia smithii]XP_055536437.1 uncharacterized protein LOC129725061 [Wyeomyia smithii]XP_055536438.1 uncharacterized protein LOC129725061 [Wyeomyia smithii]XP_055536439.1 uncharacterized protein LOC129725061 [Wyeomyia smithii]XP_055536440.1 uncharacterized protein LOC129725061 [Wyeomyia smithii]